jgi:hypothetical protein
MGNLSAAIEELFSAIINVFTSFFNVILSIAHAAFDLAHQAFSIALRVASSALSAIAGLFSTVAGFIFGQDECFLLLLPLEEECKLILRITPLCRQHNGDFAHRCGILWVPLLHRERSKAGLVKAEH